MTGIVRGLDPQRRLVIPKETLKAAGVEPGDLLEVWSDLTEDGAPCVVLKKYRPGCVICGTDSEDKVTYANGRKICRGCLSVGIQLFTEPAEGEKEGE